MKVYVDVPNEIYFHLKENFKLKKLKTEVLHPSQL
jgi:hypothetical protein